MPTMFTFPFDDYYKKLLQEFLRNFVQMKAA